MSEQQLQNENERLRNIIKTVSAMRIAQKDYFRFKGSQQLRKAKQLETDSDKLLIAWNSEQATNLQEIEKERARASQPTLQFYTIAAIILCITLFSCSAYIHSCLTNHSEITTVKNPATGQTETHIRIVCDSDTLQKVSKQELKKFMRK